MALSAGTELGPYSLVNTIGAGGMGEVYKAFDKRLDRYVAIKVLARDQVADPERRLRFIQEAKTASALNHPNIVTVHEISNSQGLDYIVMELVPGKTLQQLIGHKGLPIGDVLKYGIQIANALSAAHEAGIVHRDLKPGNVIISESGTAKVVDFGIAKLTETEHDDYETVKTRTMRVHTSKGQVFGTVAYMSPEQAEGKEVDGRSDIFAFGSLLYEMLTGRKAFAGPSGISTLGAILHKEPAPLHELSPDVPEGLERVISRCLRKDPEDRWQHMDDIAILLEDLRREWESGPVTAALGKRRSSWRAVALACIAGALIVAGAGLAFRDKLAPEVPEPRLTMLTADSGFTAFPAISTDGSLVVYASDRAREGSTDIWAQQINGRAIRLTSDPADETDPDISPDGSRVVFRSEKEGGGVYVVPSLGGDPTLLAPGGRNPRFSPDGKWIAYWVGREGRALIQGTAKVFIMPAGGGQPQPMPGNFAAALFPVWSPDGNSLLVLGRRNPDLRQEPTPDWWVVPMGSGKPVATGARARLKSEQLLPLLWHSNIVARAWIGTDGGQVAFSALHGDAVNLWKIPVSLRTGQCTGNPTRVTMGTGIEISASFATTGRIVFSSLLLGFNMWEIPVDAERGIVTGEMKQVTEGSAFELFPTLSQDGNKLAFMTGRAGLQELRVRDRTSRRELTVISGSTAFNAPLLSGDGRSIVFVDGRWNMLRIPAKGGTVLQLCDSCGTPTQNSYDGRTVVFEPKEAPEDVRMLDTDTRKVSVVVPAAGSLYGGKLSHDRNWVAFRAMSGKTDESQIWIARVIDGKAVDRSQWIPITDNDATEIGVTWSPGDNVLYYLSDRDSFRCLWARKLDPATKKPIGPQFAVMHFHHARRSLKRMRNLDAVVGPTIAGNTMVISIGELTGNVWVRDPGQKINADR